MGGEGRGGNGWRVDREGEKGKEGDNCKGRKVWVMA